MFDHGVPAQLGISRLQRGDNVDVLPPVPLADVPSQAAQQPFGNQKRFEDFVDDPCEVQVLVDLVLEDVVTRTLGDQSVQALVEFIERLKVARGSRILRVKSQPIEGSEIPRGHLVASQFGRQSLQCRTNLVELDQQRLSAEVPDDASVFGHRLDHAKLRQAFQRLPNRRPADSKLLRQFDFSQPLTG